MWQCKLRNLVAKFATYTSGDMLLLNLIQVSHGVNFWVRCASGNVCGSAFNIKGVFPWAGHWFTLPDTSLPASDGFSALPRRQEDL